MTLLPLENLTYRSPLSAQELHQELLEAVEDGPPGSSLKAAKGKSGKAYRGQVRQDRFDIVRQISYRNSFLPRVSGKIEPQPSGCMVKVKMQMHPFVMVFLLVWCFMLVGIGGNIIAAAMDGPGMEWMAAIPIGMLLFAYGITMAGFKTESRKTKKELAQLFQAKKDPFGREGFY